MAGNDKKKRMNELKELLEYEMQFKDLLRELEYKIYDLEGIYLEETPMGNILKGWEIDGKPLSSRPRTVDEKERLFSNSSYRVYMEGKLATGNDDSNTNTNNSGNSSKGRKYDHSQNQQQQQQQQHQHQYNQPKKKVRRTTSVKKEGIYDDWENDY